MITFTVSVITFFLGFTLVTWQKRGCLMLPYVSEQICTRYLTLCNKLNFKCFAICCVIVSFHVIIVYVRFAVT